MTPQELIDLVGRIDTGDPVAFSNGYTALRLHAVRIIESLTADLAAAQARVKELEEAQTWQGIGSAPHTPDAWFLVWHPQTGAGLTFWNAGKFYSYTPGDEPTHWMPLPSPPALTGDER